MEVDSKIISMDAKVTWTIEVLRALMHSEFKFRDVVRPEITKITWRIENFSSIEDESVCSQNFIVDGIKWQIRIFPEGDIGIVDYMSICLEVVDSAKLPHGWSTYTQYGFAVINQIDRKASCIKVTEDEFNAKSSSWCYLDFLALSELHNPKRGYLVEDACLFESYVSTDRIKGLISRGLIVNADSDRVKAIQHEESNKSAAIEPEEPTEQDIETFFTSLESELTSTNIVSSRYEVKKAMTKLDEAFNMTPVNFYDSETLSPVKQAFKILASLDYSTTSLTIEEKNELVAMEERLKELADRATKALEDKHDLTEMQSMKLMITRKLDRNLIKYKKVKRKSVSLLAERNGVFKSSKEMKMELEALQKESAEYEAKAKIAEEEAKIVEAEWGKMKIFISPIKGKI